MKTFSRLLPVCILFLLGQLFYGCQKEETEEYEVNFSFGVSGTTTNSSLKSAFESSIKKANSIILTIMKSDGGSTTYSSTKISIYTEYGFYYSKKILLPPGSYKLTEFLIADSTGNIIYAVPTAGSVLANAVENPLPILFTVSKNQSTLVPLEVISTEGNSCSDFGVLWFPIKEVGVVKVHVAVVDKMTSKLISAELEVIDVSYSESYSRIFNLEANANNLIVVPDRYEYYEFSISKEGYFNYVGLISMDSLKKWASNSSSVPLIIELEIQDEGFVTDIDGNVYKTIKIGSQIWMAENLRTTHYNDGTAMFPYESGIDGEFTWYNDDETGYKIPYGALYSWYVVHSGKLAPIGWHVATDTEWRTLINYLGGSDIAGGKLKEAGTSHWQSPNSGATNETRFSAVATGYKGYAGGNFRLFGEHGYWWTSSEWIAGEPYYVMMMNNSEGIGILSTDGLIGFSVRCIKDL